MKHVQDRFSITIPKSLQITFIHIPPMTLLTNKRFTLIMESIHSMKLAYNALSQFTPHVYIDTTGCAFTFIVAKLLANCKVIAYVHYPTISTVRYTLYVLWIPLFLLHFKTLYIPNMISLWSSFVIHTWCIWIRANSLWMIRLPRVR